MNYKALMRMRLMEQLYDRLSDEEKRTFVQLSIQDKGHEEIMHALSSIDKKADRNRHSWIQDFGANVAGNAAWDGFVWLASRLIKKL